MNSLTQYITQNALDPVAAMNALQEHGIVADNCITSDDVAEADAFAAMKWLKYQFKADFTCALNVSSLRLPINKS